MRRNDLCPARNLGGSRASEQPEGVTVLRAPQARVPLYLGLVQLGEQAFNERLEQKDDRQPLNSLTMPPERQPRPVWLVPNNNLGLRQKIPRLLRHQP
jgi:hypothetical protein